jgi:hypothetical protein
VPTIEERRYDARKWGVSACFGANASDRELVEAARQNQELRKKLFGDSRI